MRLTDKEVDTIIHHGMRRLQSEGGLDGWVEAGAARGRGWRCFWLAVLATGCLGLAGLAKATTITAATITCANCTSLKSLQYEAILHANAYPIPGTVIVVVSLNAPLAGAFEVTGTRSCPGGPGIQLVCLPVVKPLTLNNAQALALSETMFARAAKITVPVKVPYPYPSDNGTVSNSIESVLIFQNSGSANLFHFIVPNDGSLGFTPSGTVTYWDYTVDLSGIGMYGTQIFVGDMLTVTFSNGFTARYQFQGAGGAKNTRWKLVPGSIMQNGKPFVPPPPPPAPVKPQAGFGAADGSSTYGEGGRVLTEMNFGSCTGVSTVTFSTESGTFTQNGFFTYGCFIP